MFKDLTVNYHFNKIALYLIKEDSNVQIIT